MSMNSALLAGVSGLKANASALAAISDNIANVNTVGYKRSAAAFETLVTAANSSGAYNAGGVIAPTRQYISAQGLLQQTTSSTDLGIMGQGFFVTTEKAEGVQSTDTRSFTRAGSFQVDQLGYMRNSSGLYLQGWQIDAQGVVLSDPSDLTRMVPINVTAVGGTAEPTTRVSINANLKSSLTANPAEATYNPLVAANSMSSYDPTVPGSGIKPDFEVQVPVSDSKGGKRTVAISFLKDPTTPNRWHAEIRAVPASDVEYGAGSTLHSGQLRTGYVQFTQDGRYDPLNSNLFGPAGAPIEEPLLQFGASDDVGLAANEVKWAGGLGVNAPDIRFDFGLAAGGLTQYDSQSVVQAVSTNGTAFGNLSSIDIDENGFVTAEFDNGVLRRIAQVALATFPNPDGLQPVSGNAVRVSIDSGTYNLKAPGTGGAGFIRPSALESSTVDLSTEFTGLITTQRAYSASSKIITTADEMLEELLRIKR